MADCFNTVPEESRFMAGLGLIPAESRSPREVWVYACAAARWTPRPRHDLRFAAWRGGCARAREVVLAARAGLPLAWIEQLSPLPPLKIRATLVVWAGLAEADHYRGAVEMLTMRVPMFVGASHGSVSGHGDTQDQAG